MYSYWREQTLSQGYYYANGKLRISPLPRWTFVIDLGLSTRSYGVDIKRSPLVELAAWLCGGQIKDDCVWFTDQERGNHFAWLMNAYSQRYHFTCQDYIPF